MIAERNGFVHVAYSTHPVAAIAVGEIVAELIEHKATRPDLLCVFVTKPFAGILEDIAPALRRLLSPTTLIGCAAEQVINPDGWLLDGPAICVLAINQGEVEGLRYSPNAEVKTSESTTDLLMADPFSFNVSLMSSICGGYAFAGEGPGSSRLVLNDQLFTDGAVGVRFPADQPIRTYADSFLLDAQAWMTGVAVLAFTEVDLELWSAAASTGADGPLAPALTGFVSKRAFPVSLTVFGEQIAREQENKGS